jgi:hypothetical protein
MKSISFPEKHENRTMQQLFALLIHLLYPDVTQFYQVATHLIYPQHTVMK